MFHLCVCFCTYSESQLVHGWLCVRNAHEGEHRRSRVLWKYLDLRQQKGIRFYILFAVKYYSPLTPTTSPWIRRTLASFVCATNICGEMASHTKVVTTMGHADGDARRVGNHVISVTGEHGDDLIALCVVHMLFQNKLFNTLKYYKR